MSPSPADKNGIIPYILYANWRNTVSPDDIERIELLNPQSPLSDLQTRAKKIKKFAVISRIPTPDNTYYPIPYYAALFKGKWYNTSNSSASPRKRNSKTPHPSNATSRLPTPFGITFSKWRASPIEWSSRSVTTRRMTTSSAPPMAISSLNGKTPTPPNSLKTMGTKIKSSQVDISFVKNMTKKRRLYK